METIYDWSTVAVFALLVVLFLHRSAAEEQTDNIYQYLPPALGCAAANYVGNHGQGPLSIVIIAAVLIYIVLVLKPFRGLKLWGDRP